MAVNRPQRILVTAGPTAEDIDPVRFLTNRSTGRMGVEVAKAAMEASHEATLILGPVPISPPAGVRTVPVRSAADMARAVRRLLPGHDALVMAAAVADYTPAEPLDIKLKKQDGDLFLKLKRTEDILAGLRDFPERGKKCIVGFSLDVERNAAEGRRKLAAKNLDFIVVNTVSSFGSDRESALLISRSGEEDWGEIDKAELARRIVDRILSALG